MKIFGISLQELNEKERLDVLGPESGEWMVRHWCLGLEFFGCASGALHILSTGPIFWLEKTGPTTGAERRIKQGGTKSTKRKLHDFCRFGVFLCEKKEGRGEWLDWIWYRENDIFYDLDSKLFGHNDAHIQKNIATSLTRMIVTSRMNLLHVSAQWRPCSTFSRFSLAGALAYVSFNSPFEHGTTVPKKICFEVSSFTEAFPLFQDTFLGVLETSAVLFVQETNGISWKTLAGRELGRPVMTRDASWVLVISCQVGRNSWWFGGWTHSSTISIFGILCLGHLLEQRITSKLPESDAFRWIWTKTDGTKTPIFMF